MADQELEFEPEPFPVSLQGHTLKDSEKTMVMGISLYCFKPGTNAFPSIQLAEREGLEIRAASNAKFIYFWGKGRLFAINLDEVIVSARFHLTGKTEKKAAPEVPKAEPVQDAPAQKRRVNCCLCREVDIDLFVGTQADATGKNGWIIAAGKATCPQCLAAKK